MRLLIDKVTLPAGRILVALSGGADSVALLRALCDAKCNVIAAHLNHMLRGDESDSDEAFCATLCARLGVPFQSSSADVISLREHGEGVEEAARRIRYGYLEQVAVANGCTAVATAHNANDNAETILMNLARGTGVDGLAGIAPTRILRETMLIRPLIAVTRGEIEAYLTDLGQSYIHDRTNDDTAYTRNFVRHEIVPRMLAVNTRFVEHCTALSGDIRSASDDAKRWRAEYLAMTGHTLSRVHVEAIRSLSHGDNVSGEVSLPHGFTARRVYNSIVFCVADSAEPPDEMRLVMGVNRFGDWTVTLVEGKPTVKIGNLAFVREDLLPKLTVRTRAVGDEISPAGRGWTKPLQRLFIDDKIPKSERDLTPVVCADGRVAAVPGFSAHKEYCEAIGMRGVLILFAK